MAGSGSSGMNSPVGDAMSDRRARRIAVALQGGGSHGAFTWGVLDRLLLEPDFEIVGIINIASAHGLVASATKAAYVAAKHGLVGLTKVVGLETARSPITCNAICPGWGLTPLVQKQIDDSAARTGISNDEAKARLLAEKQPSLEFATSEQIGAAVVFLCSPAADQIRGASISMDGGWTVQ
jgi:NAD(P)-dependent dehydrogenase (short-subunit alcohol dehydrogenase family)